MNRTRALTALAAGLLLLAGCSGEPSYEQAADQCIAAVKALPANTQRDPKPKACERMTEKDYNVIFASKVLKEKGLMTPSP